MPDLEDRSELENDYTGQIAGALEKFRSDYVKRIYGDNFRYEDIEELNKEDEDKLKEFLAATLGSLLVSVFLKAATQFANAVGFGDSEDLERQAQAWARRRETYLLQELIKTTNDSLRLMRSRTPEIPLTRRELLNELSTSRLFGLDRAALIAVTEISESISAGEIAILEALRRNGVKIAAFWYTALDDRVCPICFPLHGTRITDDYPPAHPRCRCYVGYRYSDGDKDRYLAIRESEIQA